MTHSGSSTLTFNGEQVLDGCGRTVGKIFSVQDRTRWWFAPSRVRFLFTPSDLRRLADKIEEEQYRAAAIDMSWVEEFGSEELKRCIAERVDCLELYQDERLLIERPGWVWRENVKGYGDKPRFMGPCMFSMLDDARTFDPEAKVIFWSFTEDTGTNCRYVVTASFLGRQILYGVPDNFLRTLEQEVAAAS